MLLPGEAVETRAVLFRPQANWFVPPSEVDAPVQFDTVWIPATVTHVGHHSVTVAYADGRRRTFERADVRRAVANDA